MSEEPVAELDDQDRRIINHLQDGLPVTERPYAQAAEEMGMAEEELLRRLRGLLDAGLLSRFGPMFRPESLGGAVTLAAMAVPAGEIERVAEILNGYPEVAHNYEREHRMNLWFVLAVEKPERIDEVIAEIEADTGFEVINMPKREEFFVGLRFEV